MRQVLPVQVLPVFDTISTLTESKLLPSHNSYKKYTGKQLAELTYLHLLGLHILINEKSLHVWAKQYAYNTVRYISFEHWKQSATDLYMFLYGLQADDIELRQPDISKDFISTLYYDPRQIITWLRNVAHEQISHSLARRLLVTLDTQFQVKDSSQKAIRRLVMDWENLSDREHKLALTRLLQIMRVRCHGSDILLQLELLAHKHHLEMHDVCNLETGEGCGASGPVTAYLGYLGSPTHVDEDASMGATSAAGIAPVVASLGAVRRRNYKVAKSKTK